MNSKKIISGPTTLTPCDRVATISLLAIPILLVALQQAFPAPPDPPEPVMALPNKDDIIIVGAAFGAASVYATVVCVCVACYRQLMKSTY